MESRVTDEFTNDPEPYGRAALLLVESLIHGLTARAVLSIDEAVAIMEIALDAQVAIADEASPTTPSMDKTTALIASIVESLKIDLPVGDAEAKAEGGPSGSQGPSEPLNT